MEWVVKTGSSVEAALQAALAELGIQRGEAEFEVVQEAQKGLFGFLGGQEAIVKVRPIPQTASFASDFVQEVTRQLGVTVDVETRRENGYVFCDVFGKNVGLLIGRRGQTLDALQYLVNVAGSRHCPGHERVILDVEGYRSRRKEALERLAARVADRVRNTGRRVRLEPMSPHERKVIHVALQQEKGITTFSEGEEPYRKVVIAPQD
ncbi:MAG TPA: protein jag [Firmicutes bacterium]|jgi:spoIIIJ-associated protein|nr:protein jag [Bacillota bacterium]